MKIIPFGKLTDILSEIEFSNAEMNTWYQVKRWLFHQYPALEHESLLIAVNTRLIDPMEDCPLYDRDVISLLPPFSGG